MSDDRKELSLWKEDSSLKQALLLRSPMLHWLSTSDIVNSHPLPLGVFIALKQTLARRILDLLVLLSCQNPLNDDSEVRDVLIIERWLWEVIQVIKTPILTISLFSSWD